MMTDLDRYISELKPTCWWSADKNQGWANAPVPAGGTLSVWRNLVQNSPDLVLPQQTLSSGQAIGEPQVLNYKLDDRSATQTVGIKFGNYDGARVMLCNSDDMYDLNENTVVIVSRAENIGWSYAICSAYTGNTPGMWHLQNKDFLHYYDVNGEAVADLRSIKNSTSLIWSSIKGSYPDNPGKAYFESTLSNCRAIRTIANQKMQPDDLSNYTTPVTLGYGGIFSLGCRLYAIENPDVLNDDNYNHIYLSELIVFSEYFDVGSEKLNRIKSYLKTKYNN